MIDFACKEFDLKEIVKCSLGLTRTEFMLLDHLIKSDEDFTADELADVFRLDLSTVQRSMKRFFEKNLVQRRQKNLDSGGYVYCYRIKDKAEIRKIILSIVKNWTSKVEEELKRW